MEIMEPNHFLRARTRLKSRAAMRVIEIMKSKSFLRAKEFVKSV